MTNWSGLLVTLLSTLAAGAALLILNKLVFKSSATAGKYLGLVGVLVSLGLSIVRIMEAIFSSTVSVNLHVAQFWPTLPETLAYQTSSSVKIVTGGFQTAEVQVQGLPLPARLTVGLEAAMEGLVFGIAFLVLFRIASHVSKNLEFKSLSHKWIRAMGGIVIGAGVVSAISSAIGRSLLSQQVFGQNASWKIDKTIPNPWLPKTGQAGDSALEDLHHVYGLVSGSSDQAFTVDFSLWPFAVGLVMLLVATVIKRGQHLNDEVEDLI